MTYLYEKYYLKSPEQVFTGQTKCHVHCLHKLMKNCEEYQALPKPGIGQRPAASPKKQFINFVL